MSPLRLGSVLAASILAIGTAAFADDDDGNRGNNSRKFDAKLFSYNEVPTVSSVARGKFQLKIIDDSSMEYELSYDGMEGSTTMAHIHFGARGTAGGIMIWLCANNPPITNAPAGTQTCPEKGGSIKGTIKAENVVGPNGQGITAGELDEAMDAIRGGFAYANVHSTLFPSGEIRGQLR